MMAAPPPAPQGTWSIGIFKGKTPWTMRPLEQWRPRVNTPAAWPPANPVYSCARVTDVPSSFVADPFLWPQGDRLYLFYETKSLHNMQVGAEGGGGEPSCNMDGGAGGAGRGPRLARD